MEGLRKVRFRKATPATAAAPNAIANTSNALISMACSATHRADSAHTAHWPIAIAAKSNHDWDWSGRIRRDRI